MRSESLNLKFVRFDKLYDIGLLLLTSETHIKMGTGVRKKSNTHINKDENTCFTEGQCRQFRLPSALVPLMSRYPQCHSVSRTSLLPTIMGTMENEDERIHIAITCNTVQFGLLWSSLTCYAADIKCLHLPEILKPGFRATPRRLYAVVSIEDCPSIYEVSSLDPEAYMTPPMVLWAVLPANQIHLTPLSLSKPSANLNIKLFAKRNHHDDTLLAEARMQVNGFANDTDSEGLSCHVNSYSCSLWQRF